MASQPITPTATLSHNIPGSCAAILTQHSKLTDAERANKRIYEDAKQRVLGLPENKKLKQEVIDEIVLVKDSDDLLKLIEGKKGEHKIWGHARQSLPWRTTKASLDIIERFKDLIGALSQLSTTTHLRSRPMLLTTRADPAIAAPVWGGICFLIQVSRLSCAL